MFRKFLLKVTAGVLAFSMALAMPAVPAVAEENDYKESYVEQLDDDQVYEEKEYATTTYTSTCGNYKYTINEDGTITVASYLRSDKVVTIPARLDGYVVSTIGEKVFYGKSLDEVIISEGVTTIANGAFNSNGIKNISIPASVTYIGDDAFWGRNVQPIVILNSNNKAYKAENNAIISADGKKLLIYSSSEKCENYTVADGVEQICPYAFARCNIDNIVLPNSVTEIDTSAFWFASTKSITLSESLVKIGSYAFYNANIKDITIPAGVKEIEKQAFSGCKLESLIIENGVEIIGESAFWAVGIKNVTIPASIKEIKKFAFAQSGLKSVTIEEGVETIGYGAFETTNLKNVTIPASVTTIEERAFSNIYSLTEITVNPASKSFKVVNDTLCTYDGKIMIAYCIGKDTQSYRIPEGVETILGGACFSADNLTDIVVPEGVKNIGSEAFYGCALLKEIQLPHTIESMKSDVLGACGSLENLVLPGKLKRIEYGLFSGCTSLKSLFIPSEVCYINFSVFKNCTALTDIYYVGSEMEWNALKIEDGNGAIDNVTIYYLSNLKDFVSRMYTVALGREYDAVGLNGWVQQLIEETHDGAGLAREFVLGEEFALRNLSDQQYVDTLYTTFFNREADATGKELWLATLSAGQSREYVLSQFVNSDEFTLLCLDYGINRGVMFTNGTVAAPGLPQFVIRLYGQVLGRAAEKDGLYNWSEALVTKAVTAEEAAVNFFMSQEYELKNVDSITFVTDCYSVFMDREADEAGLAFWVACLDEQGVSRQWVISEFAKSAEFKEIAAKYGL